MSKIIRYWVENNGFDNFYDFVTYVERTYGLEFTFDGKFEDLTEQQKQEAYDELLLAIHNL